MKTIAIHLFLGLSTLAAAAAAEEESTPEGFQPDECRAWVEDTYRVEPLAGDFELDLGEEITSYRACVARDVQLMSVPIPQTWCDNVFKIHCSGLDLLAEIGEQLVDRCEQALAEQNLDKKTLLCLEEQVFESYSERGFATPREQCEPIAAECQKREK